MACLRWVLLALVALVATYANPSPVMAATSSPMDPSEIDQTEPAVLDGNMEAVTPYIELDAVLAEKLCGPIDGQRAERLRAVVDDKMDNTMGGAITTVPSVVIVTVEADTKAPTSKAVLLCA